MEKIINFYNDRKIENINIYQIVQHLSEEGWPIAYMQAINIICVSVVWGTFWTNYFYIKNILIGWFLHNIQTYNIYIYIDDR